MFKLEPFNTSLLDKRIRFVLLVLAGFICLTTALELYLAEHFRSYVQLIPFVLAGLGFVGVLVVLIKANKGTLRALRIIMMIVVLGSLFGIFEHTKHNFEFHLEIRPNAQASDVSFAAVRGPNPLLAPSILAFAGVLALLATYYHPVLRTK